VYQVGINKGIILRCTAYQISSYHWVAHWHQTIAHKMRQVSAKVLEVKQWVWIKYWVYCPFPTGRLKTHISTVKQAQELALSMPPPWQTHTPPHILPHVCGATGGPPCFDGPLHKQGCIHAGRAPTWCPKSHIAAVTPHLTATAFQRLVLAGQVDLFKWPEFSSWHQK